jgi:hypothetical protein
MNTKTIKRRARTDTGHFKSDDPSTPDVNEAWEVAEKPKEKAAPVNAPEPDFVWFESRNSEPSMFEVAGISPIRNFSNGRLEYRVKPDDADRFSQNHFVMNGRIVRK